MKIIILLFAIFLSALYPAATELPTLISGAESNAAVNTIPKTPSSPDENNSPDKIPENTGFQYIKTAYTGFLAGPVVTVINSQNEFDKFIVKNIGHSRDGVMYPVENDMIYAADKYNDDFFKLNYLVLVEITENSGSNRHEVESIGSNGDITIKRIVPEIGTADMAQWCIIIELDADFVPGQFNVILHPVDPPFIAQPQEPVPGR